MGGDAGWRPGYATFQASMNDDKKSGDCLGGKLKDELNSARKWNNGVVDSIFPIIDMPSSVQVSTRLDLPISGMTCAACAARIEKLLKRLPGVTASVNLASERASVELASSGTSPRQVVATIEKAGFGVPPQTLELGIEGMTCAACAARLEKALNRVEGVEAAVNLASERARVRYRPGIADVDSLLDAVTKAGFSGYLLDVFSRVEE
jgi:Cu+-exporting ATPase